MEQDEIVLAMREDQVSASFAFQRMREVVDNALLSESEQQMVNFRNENVVLREQLLMIKQRSISE